MSQDLSEEPKKLISISQRAFIICIIILLMIVLWLLWPFLPHKGAGQYSNIDEHFRYGSIGGENSDGIPYWILKVLPTVFPDKLAGEGLTSLGFIQEPDHEFPIGFAKSKNNLFLGLGIDVVTQNCAICHVGLLRSSPKEKTPRIISTMPGMTVNIQGFIQFLTEVAVDERFNADNLMPYMDAMGAKFNPLERLIYRYLVIPQTRDELIHQKNDFAFMDKQTAYGPGRVDTFTSYKTRRYGFPAEKLADSELHGIADFPSIWNQRPRQKMRLHWDGNNNDGSERNRTAALALVSPTTINFDSLSRLREWLMDVPAPPYPFAINDSLAAKGKPLYDANCASCHAPNGSKIGMITPIEQVKTDSGRLYSYTYELASNQNLTFSGIKYRGVDQRFSHFQKTNGYTNMLLDGIWLRSPYLHNGSVPTLEDLLAKPEERPENFYRGYDVYDQNKVGYVADVAQENGQKYFQYDTKELGNGNYGHLYGTELSADEKKALLEYLKTL